MRRLDSSRYSGPSPYKAYLLASLLLGVGLFILLSVYLPYTLIGLRIFIALTGTAFLLMGLDKQIAGTGATRVPELVLWGIAACGGSLGMFLGMQAFRHKTRKAQFQFVLLLLFVAQLAFAKYVANGFGIYTLRDLFSATTVEPY